MADNSNLQSVADNFGSVASDIGSASDSAKKGAAALEIALKGLGRLSKHTFSALASGSSEFRAYDNAVTSGANSLRSLAKLNSRYGGSISFIITAVEKVTKSVFGFNDALIKYYDGFSNYGITVGKSTDELLKVTHSAGYYLNNSDKFYKLVESTNTTLLALAPTTHKAVDRLANVFSTTNEQKEFLRLGYTPERLNKAQVDYIKMQSGYGVKLSTNDAAIKESSLGYIRSLTYLSEITGLDRDKLAQEIAQLDSNIRFRLKKRQLTLEGNKDAVDNMNLAAGTLSSVMGKDVGVGLVDLFSTDGIPTTAEGEALVFKTQGRIQGWIMEMQNGMIPPDEFIRRVARAEKEFVEANKSALAIEKAGDSVKSTGQSYSGSLRLLEIGSIEDAKKMQAAAMKKEDSAKNLQNEQINTERITGLTFDNVRSNLSGPVTAAFTAMMALVRQLAIGTLKFGIWLSKGTFDEAAQAMEKMLSMLGNEADIQKIVSNTEKEITEVDKKIEDHKKYAIAISEAEKRVNETVEQQRRLEEEQRKSGVDNKAERAKTDKLLKERKAEVEKLKKQEAETYKGETSESLKAKREQLVKQKQQAQQQLEAKKPAESGKQEPEGKKPVEPGASNDSYTGLKIKNKDSTAGGPASPKLIAAAKQLQSMFGDRGFEITAFDDKYHRKERPNSPHTKGIAMDFVLRGNGPKDPTESLAIKRRLQEMGLFSDVRDEYFTQRQEGTLPHFHVQVPGFKTGGIARGSKSGYQVTLHGDEAVIPLLPNKTVAIELTSKDSLTDFSQIRNSITKKITKATYSNSSDGSNDIELVTMLLDKIERFTSLVDRSNSIHGDLKIYMNA
jgi:hypothetical protein